MLGSDTANVQQFTSHHDWSTWESLQKATIEALRTGSRTVDQEIWAHELYNLLRDIDQLGLDPAFK